MTHVADDIVCDAPGGRIAGAGAYRAFMGPFVDGLASTRIIAAFGDETTAMVMYEAGAVLPPGSG